ncbi:MAG: osmotically inducible protein C [Deltaproteobacteria bacterium]|nr:osmotically inducible protein C [Deltaproteobacteria bacterium]
MEMNIQFTGGLRVDAVTEGGTIIPTDQSPESGGEGSAPEPYQLFMASIGTCAGIYVLKFCLNHGLPTDGIRLVQHSLYDEEKHRMAEINIEVHVPDSFPEKYRKALARSANLCAVKKTILDPPEFDVKTVVD